MTNGVTKAGGGGGSPQLEFRPNKFTNVLQIEYHFENNLSLMLSNVIKFVYGSLHTYFSAQLILKLT